MSGSRCCPFCGAAMNTDATLCATCGRFSVDKQAAAPVDHSAVGAATLLDRANAAIARWEARSPLAQRIRVGISLPMLRLSPGGRKVLGAGLIAWGIALLVVWIGADRFEAARFGVAAIVTGVVVLRAQRASPDVGEPITETGPPPSGAVRLFGADTNLVVVQIVAASYMVERAYWLQVDQARWAAGAVVVLAALLYTARVYAVPLTLAAAAAAYAIDVTAQLDSFSFRRATHYPVPELVVPLWPVFYSVAVLAMFPQLTRVRWGGLRLGALRGDTEVRCFGSRVPIAFASAALLAAGAATIVSFLYLPFWASVVYYWII